MMEGSDFLRLVGVRKTEDPLVFEAVSLPGRAGNQQPIAYGGCAVAGALLAAGQTIPTEPRKVPYSIVGHFLGPATLDARFVYEVQVVRDTRTFSTRYVTVKQPVKGKLRPVLALTLDTVASPGSTKEALDAAAARHADPGKTGSLLRYHRPASIRTDNVDELMPTREYLQKRVSEGSLEASLVDMYNEFLGLWNHLFDGKVVPESVMIENLLGLHPQPMAQSKLPMTERTSYDWFKLFQQLPPADGTNTMTEPGPDGMLPVSAVSAQTAALAFAMDAALAFMPVSHSGESMLRAGAASTLDFAHRFHTDVFDMNTWKMREIMTKAGGWQRTYSEGWLYDQDGQLVSSCTQQCVLRPAPGALDEDHDVKSKL